MASIAQSADDSEPNEESNEEAESDEQANARPKWQQWVLASIRRIAVSAVFVVVFAGIFFAILTSNARKKLHRSLSTIGSDLVRQYELEEGKLDDVEEGERVFVLNGQEIYVRVGRDERGVDDLLASMPGRCERLDEDGQSHQTCVTDELSLDTLTEVARGGGAANLEGLKYRLAIGQDEGGTFYLDLSPKGEFDPARLMGNEDEDVEGPDHADIPRPPSGRRFVSAHERGRPYLASFFTGSEESPREIKEFYRNNMDPEIWTETEFEDDPDGFVMFRRRGAPHRFVAITIRESDTPENGTLTAITEAQ